MRQTKNCLLHFARIRKYNESLSHPSRNSKIMPSIALGRYCISECIWHELISFYTSSVKHSMWAKIIYCLFVDFLCRNISGTAHHQARLPFRKILLNFFFRNFLIDLTHFRRLSHFTFICFYSQSIGRRTVGNWDSQLLICAPMRFKFLVEPLEVNRKGGTRQCRIVDTDLRFMNYEMCLCRLMTYDDIPVPNFNGNLYVSQRTHVTSVRNLQLAEMTWHMFSFTQSKIK